MIDAHIHLEYGPLDKAYVEEFIQQAIQKGLEEISILDHTHRFKEFERAYEHLKCYPIQKQWLESKTKFCNTLDEYQALIQEVKKETYPIRIQFGLEVCYTKDTEDFLREVLSKYSFDFLTGAVHSFHHILYDMPFSKELLWEKYDVNQIYQEYYQAVLDCVNSKLFDRLAHPDTIKLFQIYPTMDMTNIYCDLVDALKETKVIAENNCGCTYRYQHPDLGLSDELLELFIKNEIEIITASDAHRPKDCGRYILESTRRIEETKERLG